MKKNISLSGQDLKFLSKPFAILLLTIAFLFVIVSVGYKQITQINDKIKSAKQTKNLLTQNLTILDSVADIQGINDNFLEIAIPEKNASLFFVSLIKLLASEEGLSVANLEASAGSEATGGISRSSISFDVEGSIDGVESFIDKINSSLPVSSISTVDTTLSGDFVRATLAISVFSAALPEKIPAITAPVNDLTQDEKQLLQSLGDYNVPSFSNPAVSVGGGRENPFTQLGL